MMNLLSVHYTREHNDVSMCLFLTYLANDTKLRWRRINLKRSLAVAACLPRQCKFAVPSSSNHGPLSRSVRRFDCTDGLASPPVRDRPFERKLV